MTKGLGHPEAFCLLWPCYLLFSAVTRSPNLNTRWKLITLFCTALETPPLTLDLTHCSNRRRLCPEYALAEC